MTKTQEELKTKEQLKNEELEHVDAGHFSPTWLPVDEICKDINKGTSCSCLGMKGVYGNCCDCKHNK